MNINIPYSKKFSLFGFRALSRNVRGSNICVSMPPTNSFACEVPVRGSLSQFYCHVNYTLPSKNVDITTHKRAAKIAHTKIVQLVAACQYNNNYNIIMLICTSIAVLYVSFT